MQIKEEGWNNSEVSESFQLEKKFTRNGNNITNIVALYCVSNGYTDWNKIGVMADLFSDIDISINELYFNTFALHALEKLYRKILSYDDRDGTLFQSDILYDFYYSVARCSALSLWCHLYDRTGVIF